jgi:hypothetical protein
MVAKDSPPPPPPPATAPAPLATDDDLELRSGLQIDIPADRSAGPARREVTGPTLRAIRGDVVGRAGAGRIVLNAGGVGAEGGRGRFALNRVATVEQAITTIGATGKALVSIQESA